jgi:hypothetical protein
MNPRAVNTVTDGWAIVIVSSLGVERPGDAGRRDPLPGVGVDVDLSGVGQERVVGLLVGQDHRGVDETLLLLPKVLRGLVISASLYVSPRRPDYIFISIFSA